MEKQKQSLSVPIAIIVAGALVAFGIYWTGRGSGTPAPAPAVQQTQQASLDTIKPIQPQDHVLGNPKAPVVIVEYSDTECPFCKDFQSTLKQLVTAYDGRVAWVYRYFPVHTRSEHEAEALECAAELGGNDAFWTYSDKVFSSTNSDDTLDPALLPQFASQIGLDSSKFSACLDSGKYKGMIEQDYSDVTAAGAQGTPYAVIFARGQKIPITQGALPYDAMKNIIDLTLKG